MFEARGAIMLFPRAIRSLLVALVMSVASFAQIGISITIGPPPLPVYEQPICPAEGYIWTPGYWAYGPYGYYWVPGTWVLAPQVGYLWTPPWWGWGGSGFIFHEGYWGPRVGFYGGIVYGFGYFGHGYDGGRWDNGHFFYNRSVTNVNVTNIRNVYNTTVINNNSTTVNRVSYNGGNGGTNARPTTEEEAATREPHAPATAVQMHHAHAAFTNPQLRDSVNHGRPSVAATPKAGAFNDRAAVAAKEAGGPYKPENNVPRPPNATVHAKDLPSVPRPPAPNTGNPKLDQKYHQQQNQLYAQQEQEHQRLQQQQERDHQQLDRQNASQAQRQQVEQKHQQQTQQMEERHTQQQEHLQARQQLSHGGQPRGR
jgi:WXXGXW repeat (2 copies)